MEFISIMFSALCRQLVWSRCLSLNWTLSTWQSCRVSPNDIALLAIPQVVHIMLHTVQLEPVPMLSKISYVRIFSTHFPLEMFLHVSFEPLRHVICLMKNWAETQSFAGCNAQECKFWGWVLTTVSYFLSILLLSLMITWHFCLLDLFIPRV